MTKGSFNNVKLVTEVTKWVITDNLPFSMVNSKAFLSIIKRITLFLQDYFLVLEFLNYINISVTM